MHGRHPTGAGGELDFSHCQQGAAGGFPISVVERVVEHRRTVAPQADLTASALRVETVTHKGKNGLTFSEVLHQPGVAFARANLGGLLRLEGRLDEAEAELRAGLEVANALGFDYARGLLTQNLAACAWARRDAPTARRLAEDAQRIFERCQSAEKAELPAWGGILASFILSDKINLSHCHIARCFDCPAIRCHSPAYPPR